jgi:leucyl aminopeptidase
MQIRVSQGSLESLRTSALVVPVFADKRLDGAAADVDKLLGGALKAVLASGEFAGKSNEATLIHAHARSFGRVLLVGLGDRAAFKPQLLAQYGGTAVRYLGRRGAEELTLALPLEAQHHVRDSASFVVEGAIAGTVDTTTYRTEHERQIKIAAVNILAHTGSHTFEKAALEAGAAHGEVLGESVNFARILALTPANDMTPTHMAKAAESIAKKRGLKYDVLDEAKMKSLGMGSLLGVSQGSDQPAKLIVLTYNGDPSSKEKLALVGKGLTFDSGGISIKPANDMHEMKYDMCGGAGVIAAMGAIAQLKPRVNVIGVVPASENLPGPKAMKPGDILKAMNGTTIEVINTDAEGRLILADALCYARELGATRIIDAATLTGACVVALGHAASGAITNDESFVHEFLGVANTTGERYWQLPLFDDYRNDTKSEIADLRNSAGRDGGALTAAAFLERFVAKVPWIHLDIAGTAYVPRETSYMAKGPTGTPVRAFVAFVESLASGKPATNGRAVRASRNGTTTRKRASTSRSR